MLTELTHNKIISDTVTEGFIAGVNEVLVPLAEGIFGEDAMALQMYEDHLADGFFQNGRWCYPFTVLTSEGARRLWASWSVDKKRFKDSVPYSYIGTEPIDFEIMQDVPAEFSEKLAGRSAYAPEGCVRLKIHTSSDDPLFLVGKCSQTFIDEMAKQLTDAICRAMSVEGLDRSCLSLQMIFTPETYMEHTSENVTYRRLRLTDRTSAPRDFWIKWTRTDSASAYSVSDTPAEGTIVFELGEDVPQKVREKEYRFILRSDPDKYHSAMSRKNVTDWRELVKRAVKRGELAKTDNAEVFEAEDKADDALRELLTSVAVQNTAPAAAEPVHGERDTTLEDALKRILDGTFGEDEVSAAEEESAEEIAQDIAEEPEEESVDLFEAAFKAEAAVFEADDEIEELSEDIQTVKEALKIEENKENEPEEPVISEVNEAVLRAEIEAKIRLEYESLARIKAEEEAKKLLEEQERLRLENERLAQEAKRIEERRAREEAERTEREAKLKAEIEAKVRAEAREKERLAEAAMLAIQEKRRLEAEKAEELRRREEEARIKEAERRAAEERAKFEEERRLEAERIRKEAEARIAAEREAMQKALNEAKAVPAPAQQKESKPRYTFTSKRVIFFFRYHIDPNITAPMEAIIRNTLDAAGKSDVPINIKASVVDESTVCLDFVKIPREEEDIFIEIVKALGNGNLGIARAKVEQL